MQGIEYADELTVCSAIVNDCISSPMISGDVEKPAKGLPAELKFYKIEREVRYDSENTGRVDITVKRVSQEKILKLAQKIEDDQTDDPYYTSFIEAKRSKRYHKSSLSHVSNSGPRDTSAELKKAIESKRENFTNQKRYPYILVWGVWDINSEKDNLPLNYIETLLKNASFKIYENDRKIRWIPLSWEPTDQFHPPDQKIPIGKWCWVLLAEITYLN